MDNLTVSLKRFLRNKNTVTIIGIVIILVLLYIVYNGQINSAVDPIQIPIAKENIQPREKVTADKVDVIDVPSVAVTENVYQNKKDVIGKYANVNSVIPKGSMFYGETLIDKRDLPDSSFTKVKKGEVVYNFPVTMASTYGNSIMPENKIDIYMKAVEDATGKIMVGKLVENIKVLAVKDAQGRHVFENTNENRAPAFLIFGVPDSINNLLRKASYLSIINVELFPVPHGGSAPTKGDVNVTADQLKDYIEAHTINVQLNEPAAVENKKDDNNDETKEKQTENKGNARTPLNFPNIGNSANNQQNGAH